MLSILIPIYNENVVKLVKNLHVQCIKAGCIFEIVCFDDGSKTKYTSQNRILESLINVSYIELKENFGRAKIRNKLAQNARYDHLLFLDSDARITSKKFIKNYLEHLPSLGIICGGRVYSKRVPKKKTLHWTYGTKRESLPAKKRNRKPALRFHSNNFVVNRSCMLRYPFDETITGYGYEDIELAQRMQKAGIGITHIDNPVMHIGLKSNADFLYSVTESVYNLKKLQSQGKIHSTPLIKWANWLKKQGLIQIFTRVFTWIKPHLNSNLNGPNPSMTLLNMYKLNIYNQCDPSELFDRL